MSRQHSPTSTRFAVTIVAAVIAIAPFALLVSTQTAQADITDYAVYATNQVYVEGASTIYGNLGTRSGDVSLFSSWTGSPVVTGNVFTGGSIILFGGGTSVLGNVVASQDVFLSGDSAKSASIGGNVDSGQKTFVGRFGTVSGNVTAGGNVRLDDGGKISGKVDGGGTDFQDYNTATKKWETRNAVEVGNAYVKTGLPATIDKGVTVRMGPGQTVGIDNAVGGDGATVGGPITYGMPTPPATVTPEVMPTPIAFTSGGTDVTNASLPTLVDAGGVLRPGSYGVVDLGTDRILMLRAGNYYFDSFTAADGLRLYLDAAGPVPLGIYVTNSVNTGTGLLTTLTSGTAHDVYVQANTGWNSLMDTVGNFSGTVYAPYGGVNVGSNFAMTGAIYAGSASYLGSVNIQDGFVLTADPVDFSRLAVPAPGAILLGAIGLGLVGWLKRRTG